MKTTNKNRLTHWTKSSCKNCKISAREHLLISCKSEQILADQQLKLKGMQLEKVKAQKSIETGLFECGIEFLPWGGLEQQGYKKWNEQHLPHLQPVCSNIQRGEEA
jgi:hypothetical protein